MKFFAKLACISLAASSLIFGALSVASTVSANSVDTVAYLVVESTIESDFYTVDLLKLKGHLLGSYTCTNTEFTKYDSYTDGKLDVLDLISMKHNLLYGSTVQTTPATTTIVATTTPTVSDSTTQSTVTTVASQTSIATTLETTVPTTTTTVESTLQTTTPTSVTSTESTSETTTSSSEVTEYNALVNLDLSSSLEKIAITDSEIPKYNDSTGYEATDYVYSFESKYGQKYCYTLIFAEKPEESYTSTFMLDETIIGLHFWKYDGSAEPVNIFYAENPDTTDITFDYLGVSHKYKLYGYTQISTSTIEQVAQILAGTRRMGATGYDYIARYDYNLSGTIDEEDLDIMVKYFTSYPFNFGSMSAYNFSMFMTNYTIDNIPNDFILNFSFTETIPYSVVVPAQSFINEYQDLLFYCTPVQILPASYYDSLEEQFGIEFGEITSYDYLIYRLKIGFTANDAVSPWLPIATTSLDASTTWKTTGFYVRFIDEDGNYINELLPQ